MRACCAATHPEPEMVEGRLSEVRPATSVAALVSTTEESLAEREKEKEVASRLEVEKMRLEVEKMRLRQEAESRLEVDKMRLRQEAEMEKQKAAESKLDVEKRRLRQEAEIESRRRRNDGRSRR